MTTLHVSGGELQIDASLTVECGKAVVTRIGGLTVLITTTPSAAPGGTPPEGPSKTPAKGELSPIDPGTGQAAFMVNLDQLGPWLHSLASEGAQDGDGIRINQAASRITLNGVGHLDFPGRQVAERDVAALELGRWE